MKAMQEPGRPLTTKKLAVAAMERGGIAYDLQTAMNVAAALRQSLSGAWVRAWLSSTGFQNDGHWINPVALALSVATEKPFFSSPSLNPRKAATNNAIESVVIESIGATYAATKNVAGA
jgi:hypothetical protein